MLYCNVYENSQKKQLNQRTFHGILSYQNVYINQTHNLRKFVEDTYTSDMKARQLCMKIE